MSHPVGRVLAARINEPDRHSQLWNIEAVAAMGLTGNRNGEIDEYHFELVTSTKDATGKLVKCVRTESRHLKGKSFATIVGCGGTLSEAPAPGKLVVTVKLTATAKDGRVVELDELETTAVIPQ